MKILNKYMFYIKLNVNQSDCEVQEVSCKIRKQKLIFKTEAEM